MAGATRSPVLIESLVVLLDLPEHLAVWWPGQMMMGDDTLAVMPQSAGGESGEKGREEKGREGGMQVRPWLDPTPEAGACDRAGASCGVQE